MNHPNDAALYRNSGYAPGTISRDYPAISPETWNSFAQRQPEKAQAIDAEWFADSGDEIERLLDAVSAKDVKKAHAAFCIGLRRHRSRRLEALTMDAVNVCETDA